MTDRRRWSAHHAGARRTWVLQGLVRLAPLAPLGVGCGPAQAPRDGWVTGPRILAVVSEPPEAQPGEKVRYEAVVVTPAGPDPGATVAWAHCLSPRPTVAGASVAEACLSGDVLPFASGMGPIEEPVPVESCARFGPDPVLAPELRERDATGGFFMPIAVATDAVQTVALERLACGFGDLPADAAVELANAYVPNRNPRQGALVAKHDGVPVALGAIPAGAAIALEVPWDAADAESYVAFEPYLQLVVPRREAVGVAWYVTAGELESDLTGRAEDDPGTGATNVWHAPTTPGTVHAWTVQRDSRGGTSVTAYELDVVATAP